MWYIFFYGLYGKNARRYASNRQKISEKVLHNYKSYFNINLLPDGNFKVQKTAIHCSYGARFAISIRARQSL